MKINVPNFLSANSPESLREKMLEYTITSGLDVKYFDIQFDGKSWIVWFYETMNTDALLSKRIKK